MKYQAHISNAICHHPAPGCYLPAAEGGGENPLGPLFLLSAPSLLFYPPLTFLSLLPPRMIFFRFFAHKSNTEMFIPHSHATIKMIHFLHLCGFYFLAFIWLFVIRLRLVFGRFDNRTVNLSHGAQQSKKACSVFKCMSMCSSIV